MPKKKTPEEFLEDLERVHGGTITTDGRYVNAKTKLKFRCTICSHIWKVTPDSVLHHGCPGCKSRLSADSQRKEVLVLNKELGLLNIRAMGSYTNSKTRMMFNCTICGHSWKSTASKVLAGRSKCRVCHKHALRKSRDAFIEQVYSIWGKKLQIVGEYNTSLSPVKVKCTLCGYIWYPIASNILRGRGCPNCHAYTGEQLVNCILDFNGIDYNPQYNFKIKSNVHRLDTILRDRKGNWCVIQPDGEQHFKSIHHFGGRNEFEHRKQMDSDENKYLPALGVRVLRIPWFWFDLDNTFTLLKEFLGYELKKPDRDYIPKYRRLMEMSNCYKYHTAYYVSNKYNVSLQYVIKAFKLCFGMTKREYLNVHPSLNNYHISEYARDKSIGVISINYDGTTQEYPSVAEASRQTGVGAGGISNCINGKQKTAGGYKWERA